MQKKAIIITIMIIAALGMIIPGAITGAAVLKNYNETVNEVMPLISDERLMSDNAIFKISAIKNPILNEEELIMIDIENRDGSLCIKEVLVNKDVKWNETNCVKNKAMMNIKYTPDKTGEYLITINYEKNSQMRAPLQSKITIKPVKKTNSLNAKALINNETVNETITLNKSEEVTMSLVVSGNRFINITRGVLVVTIGGEHFVYEANINKVIPPLIEIRKEELIMIPPLASGEYTVKGYLYTANQDNEEAAVKEIKMRIN